MRRTHTRKAMRLQVLTGIPALNIGASLSNSNQVVLPVSNLFGDGTSNNWGAGKVVKDVMLHGMTIFTDFVCSAGTPSGAKPFLVINEGWFIDAVNASAAPAHGPGWTNFNEWSDATNPAVLPDRILMTRQGLLYAAVGEQMSSSNNWTVHHVRVKRKLEQSDALIWEVDYTNESTAVFSVAGNTMAICHLSFIV